MKYLILMVVMAIIYYAVWVIEVNKENYVYENEIEMRINNLNQNKILSLLG